MHTLSLSNLPTARLHIETGPTAARVWSISSPTGCMSGTWDLGPERSIFYRERPTPIANNASYFVLYSFNPRLDPGSGARTGSGQMREDDGTLTSLTWSVLSGRQASGEVEDHEQALFASGGRELASRRTAELQSSVGNARVGRLMTAPMPRNVARRASQMSAGEPSALRRQANSRRAGVVAKG